MKNRSYKLFKYMHKLSSVRYGTAAVLIILLMLCSCTRYEPAALDPENKDMDYSMQPGISVNFEESLAEETAESTEDTEAEEPIEETEAEEEWIDTRIPAKVRGVYLASKPVGNADTMAKILGYLDETELNAVVIDIKDDYGKIPYNMTGVPVVDEINQVECYIDDMEGVLNELHAHGVYCIARIVTMRDPYLAKHKPEWAMQLEDGTLFKDNSGYTWMNPYCEEYWEYLVEVAQNAAAVGFDEIQFDYIRFCTDKGNGTVVYDEEQTKGRDKISVITEMVQYLSSNIRKMGVYMSCDVFGTIIGSQLDTRLVGQSYAEMAAAIDYICPMVYPSHYANGNFGLDVPDKHPYEAIKGALKRSRNVLSKAVSGDNYQQAGVRPWLQSFTATWLGSGNYIKYDADAIRQQIQGVYDAGYDEWILWSASVSYQWEAMLSEGAAEREWQEIESSRAEMPEETEGVLEETFPAELEQALDGDELRPEDEAILLQDGPIVSYE